MLLCIPPAGPDIAPTPTVFVEPLSTADGVVTVGARKGVGIASCVLFGIILTALPYLWHLLQQSYAVGPRIGDGLWLEAVGLFELLLGLALTGALLGAVGLCRAGRKSWAIVGLSLNLAFLVGIPWLWPFISSPW